MSNNNSNWSKCWLYDSTVEVPKATKWRGRLEINSPVNDVETVDVRGEFALEVIDLGNNTSPFKKQKVLGDCLQDGEIKSHRSMKYNPVKKYNFSSTALQTKTRTEDGEISCEVQDRLDDCEGEF